MCSAPGSARKFRNVRVLSCAQDTRRNSKTWTSLLRVSCIHCESWISWRGQRMAIWTVLFTRGCGGVPGRQGRWTSLFPQRVFCRMVERLWPNVIPRTGSGVVYLSYILFVRAESSAVTRFRISLIVIVAPLLTAASSRFRPKSYDVVITSMVLRF